MQNTGKKMEKKAPHPDYPPEEGRYLRGNDYSPAAVIVILGKPAESIPPDIEALVRIGLEAGAAISGTVQTENIGFEKIICNIIANPNIRYAILTGPESEGHLTGEAFKALLLNGVDENKQILGTDAPHPLLYNISKDYIDRFRDQLTLIDLQFKGTKESIQQAVWSCYQEEPVDFLGMKVWDIGAYPDPPLSGKITQRVLEPWKQPKTDQERDSVTKMWKLINTLKESDTSNDH